MRSRLGLVVTSMLMAALVVSMLVGPGRFPAVAAEPADLSIPYGSGGWRYKVVGHGAEPGFEQAGVDDSAWAVGTAPFGNEGCAGTPAPVTAWPLSTDLLVRRTLDLNPATVTSDLALKVAIDNDVDVFFNGVLIASNDFEGLRPGEGHLRHPTVTGGRRAQRTRGSSHRPWWDQLPRPGPAGRGWRRPRGAAEPRRTTRWRTPAPTRRSPRARW